MAVLSVQALSKSFYTGIFRKTQHRVLENISFEVYPGETLGLAGTSGAGKSTLIRCIMQLIPSDRGKVYLEGREISDLSGSSWLQMRKNMQLLFQNPELALNPRMTIRESMDEVLFLHEISLNNEKIILKELDHFQLRHNVLERYPYQLSGGELQRICLARLLFLRPKVLILDEPTSMLDMSVQAQIIHVLKDMQQTYGITILFVSHDLALLRACCDRIGILHNGRLVELKETEEIFKHPDVEYTQEMINAFYYT